MNERLGDGRFLQSVRNYSFIVKALRPKVGADRHIGTSAVDLVILTLDFALSGLNVVLIFHVFEPKVRFGFLQGLLDLFLVRITLIAEVDGELFNLLLLTASTLFLNLVLNLLGLRHVQATLRLIA